MTTIQRRSASNTPAELRIGTKNRRRRVAARAGPWGRGGELSRSRQVSHRLLVREILPLLLQTV